MKSKKLLKNIKTKYEVVSTGFDYHIYNILKIDR